MDTVSLNSKFSPGSSPFSNLTLEVPLPIELMLKKKESFLIIPPSNLLINNLEKFFNNVFKENPSRINDSWNIDLSDCDFIEVASLIHLISLIVAKSQKGQDVFISLPKDEKVFDFLVVWGFLECLSDILSKDLNYFIDPIGLARYKVRINAPDLRYSSSGYLSGQETRILSKNFFALNTFGLGNCSNNRLLIKSLTSQWEQDNIRRVLSRHLKVPEAAKELPSRVILEAITNATLHPKAKFIVTASRFEASKHFTLVIWDDGESIVKTLKDGIRNKKAGNVFPPLFRSRRKYIYKILNEEGRQIEGNTITADYDTFDLTTPDELLFITSTFRGVTREADEVKANPSQSSDYILSARGTGLTYLINYALDICGGSVAFRINNLFMNIKLAGSPKERKSEVDYNVKIIRYGDHVLPFLGNMLTIRLPVS